MPLHLRKRNGIWHYSRTVPRDIRGVIAKRYWRQSLHTPSLREAEAARSLLDAKYQAQIDDIRRLTGSQRVATIRRVHRAKPLEDACAVDNETVFRLPMRKRDIWFRNGVNDDAREELSNSVERAAHEAERLLATLSDTDIRIVEQAGGIAPFYRRTLREQDLFDLKGDYRSAPEDRVNAVRREVQTRLHAENLNLLGKLGLSDTHAVELPESGTNPRLIKALEHWLKENGQKPVTARKYRLHIRRLAEYTGNTTIDSLTPQMIKGFVSAYSELPNARALKLAQRKLTMPELLALRKLNPDKPPMGAANVRKMVEYLRALLRGIGKEELASHAKKPKDDRPHAKRDEGYPPFKPEDVRRLLELAGASWGLQSDTTWWVWLMAYSGLRPEEAAQLARANVVKQSGIWALLVDDLDERKIKNLQSLRIIPIHPVLIERGFMEFAQVEQTSDGLIFASFEYDDKAGRSNNPSRRLKRLIKTLGIAGSGSAHRFRATFIDAIRNAQLSYAIEIGLVGHGDKNRVHGRYGEGVSLKTVASVIAKVDPLSD